MPVNIRFDFYSTPDDVRIENRFSIMPLRIPLFGNMKESYKVMKKLSSSLKNLYGFVYGVYAVSFWTSQLFPRYVNKTAVDNLCTKFTISFSNIAGLLKNFEYISPTTGKSLHNISSLAYPVIAGRMGLSLVVVSQSGYMRPTMVSDENVADQELNLKLMRLIYDNIASEIKRVKG